MEMLSYYPTVGFPSQRETVPTQRVRLDIGVNGSQPKTATRDMLHTTIMGSVRYCSGRFFYSRWLNILVSKSTLIKPYFLISIAFCG